MRMMKALDNKPLLMITTSSKEDAGGCVAAHAIKLKAITSAERQSLRISSYQYLLP